MPLAIAIHPDDNVATLVDPLSVGETAEIVLDARRLRVRASMGIRPGHKIALRDILQGDPVIKFGQRIGLAAVPIRAGDHVHVHNVSGFASNPPGQGPSPDASASR